MKRHGPEQTRPFAKTRIPVPDFATSHVPLATCIVFSSHHGPKDCVFPHVGIESLPGAWVPPGRRPTREIPRGGAAREAKMFSHGHL